MARSADELFQEFGPPSPGTTSMLLQFLTEDNQLGATSSGSAGVGWFAGSESPQSNGQGFGQPAPDAAAAFASKCPTGCQQPSTLEQQAGRSWAQLDRAARLAGNDAAGCSSLAPSFSLGTVTRGGPSHQASEEAHAGGRRRGRKPGPRLPDLQQKLEGLTEQFHKLSHENVFLRNKLKVLERVVPSRDERAGVLTKLLSLAQEQASQAEAAAASASAAPSAAPAGPSAAPAQPSLQQPEQPPPDREIDWSQARAAAAVARLKPAPHASRAGIVVGERSVRLHMLHAAQAAATRAYIAANAPRKGKGARKGAAGVPQLVAMCPGPDDELPPMSPEVIEELKRATPEDFCMLWKNVCLQLGVLLVGAEAHGAGSPPYLRLERYLQRYLLYMDKITLLSPTCFLESMYMNVETGLHERPNDQFWVSCARALQLNPQQLRDVASLATMYERNVAPVVQQRQQLAAQLTTGLSGMATTATAGAPKNARELSTWYNVDDLAKQLERNVLKEHETHQNIGEYLCVSVLTPFQVAKSMVVAYPYIPDGIAMLHAFKLLLGSGDVGPRQPQHGAPPSTAATAAAASLPALGSGGVSAGGSAPAPTPGPAAAAAVSAADLVASLRAAQGAAALQSAVRQVLTGPVHAPQSTHMRGAFFGAAQ